MSWIRERTAGDEVVGVEDDLGVAVRVGGVLLDRQHSLVVEDPVERVGRVADGGRDELARVLAVLILGPRVDLKSSPALFEVTRQGGRAGPARAAGEPLPSEGGQAPGSPDGLA